MAMFTRMASVEPVALSGRVSHVNAVSTTSGVIRGDRGSVRTEHEVWFRVANRPVVFKGVLSLADGDDVTAVGRDRGDAIAVTALRNDRTGIEHAPIIRTWPMWVLIALGIPVIPLYGLGFLLIGLGIRGFKGNRQNQEMINLLRRTPSTPS